MRDSTAHRVIARCRELALCTEIPGETTRLYLCPAMRQVHDRLGDWMRQAGLTVRLDAAGNLRGSYPSSTGGKRVLLIGSHLDTVPNAGAFDGILGVVLGLAAIEALHGDRLPFAIELIGFSEEEGVRFGRPFLGSLSLVGELDDSVLALHDRDGITVRESLRRFGAPLDELHAEILPRDGTVLGFLEMHIEQGPVLDHAGRALGVVRAIAGQTRARLDFRGQANHAGTTPMSLRHDALAAAAAWIVDVERLAQSTPGLVATVGQITAEPGAPNVIASRALASLDVRHADDDLRRSAVRSLLAAAATQAHSRGASLKTEIALDQPAVAMHHRLCDLLRQAAQHHGHKASFMVSGAGHDAMVLARRVPATMLFVRSPGGLSHYPDETVLLPDVAAALETTVRFLRTLGDHETTISIEG